MKKIEIIILLVLLVATASEAAITVFDYQRDQPTKTQTENEKKKNDRLVPTNQLNIEIRAISRINNQYRILVKEKNKLKTYQIKQANLAKEILFGKYKIKKIEKRALVLELPANHSCKENPRINLKCRDNHIIIGIKRAKPIKKINPGPNKKKKNKQQLISQKKKKPQKQSIFKRNSSNTKHQNKTINRDKKIPDNMKVIKTLFGDKLVPK